jgi:hypothetical protein
MEEDAVDAIVTTGSASGNKRPLLRARLQVLIIVIQEYDHARPI